ncbi:MAG: ATP synthase F1 subunit gamma [Dehalococcoidia bacterium]|nr:ATP synthase F1 subunit gamma [Dehalococcoidia bacterium]
MANLRIIRRRIRSVQSTAKITKAMELVAASKMRKAQVSALAARPYAERMRWVLSDLSESSSSMGDEVAHPFLERRPIKSTLILHLTPDRGLAGALNSNLNRAAFTHAFEEREEGHDISLVVVGRKGRDAFRRNRQPFLAEFTALGDYPTYEDTRPISRIVMEEYASGRVDQVVVLFPHFLNTVTQRPEARQLLPITPQPDHATEAVDYIYEPSRQKVLDELLPRYIEIQVYETVLELIASEQSARMVAMRNATDSADELIEELTLTYNKARQEQITRELLEIVGGAEVMKAS